MSWLWKDKKTDQLKSVLTKAEEEDKNSTVEKLTNIRKECLEFKKHLDKTFDKASAINTTSKILFFISAQFNSTFFLVKMNNFVPKATIFKY